MSRYVPARHLPPLHRTALRSLLLVSAFLLLTAGPWAAANAATVTVAAGGDLQAAIYSANCGDTVSVQAGASFVGNFHLPAKPCTDADPVTIQSSRAGELPAGVRVTPAQAPLMPKLLTPNSQPALWTLAGAHHYRLVGLELAPSGPAFLYDVVALGDPSAAQDTVEEIPHHLTVDRCYIHAFGESPAMRGLDLNADDARVVNSHVSGFKSTGGDTQAILTFNCRGRHLIENNYLEASGENYIAGGADAKIADLVPSDIVIRRNHMAKPLSWRGVWMVKNLLELKNARRVTIDGNVFEYSWSSGQAGYAIVFTPRNQEGSNPWATIEDVQFTNNTIRHAASGVQLLGTDNLYPSQVMKRVTIRNNLWEDISTAWGPGLANKMFLVIDGPEGVEIANNTVRGSDAPALYLAGRPAPGLRAAAGAFANGTIASAVGNGQAALSAFAPDAVVTSNELAGVFRPDLYPAGNSYPDAPSTPPPAGVGCDLAALAAAQAGATPTPTPTPTATPAPTPSPTPTPAPTPTPTPTNSAPAASFTYSRAGLVLTFTDTSTDHDGRVTAWSWAFGDGTNSAAQHPTHSYTSAGTYKVSLTVTDSGGATNSMSGSVTVVAPPSGVTLAGRGYKVKGLQKAELSWSGAASASVDVYRDGMKLTTTPNDGSQVDNIDRKGNGPYKYKVCEAGTSSCSNETTVSFN